MTDDFNPYQAPDSPIADDFIAIEPIGRPTANFVTAAICFGVAVFFLFIEGIFAWILFDLWSRAGTQAENHPIQFGPRVYILMTIACTALAFLFAGHSFWVLRNRRGVNIFLAAIGILASTLLARWLFPDQ